jgi:Protein ENHANCED DISEASE RESISTANCE 2, C-terminal
MTEKTFCVITVSCLKFPKQAIPMDDNHERVVQHAGRANIRGKIRRIWRPRYLELLDNGLVRYFECDNEDVTERDHQHLSMIPKCTLLVYRARIIDVTTLRDVHVGLPRGTYGFLFHARRLVFDDLCTSADSSDARDFLCNVPTLVDAQSWVVALQWASSYHYNQSNDMLSLVSKPLKSVQTVQHKPNQTPQKSRKENKGTKVKSETKGTIIVPKVKSLSIVRVDLITFKLAYKFELLVVEHVNGTFVEERTLLRTRRQIEDLLQQLKQECCYSEETLERVYRKIQSIYPKSYSEHVTTISTVESIFRMLALDAEICNSMALRSFWSLNDYTIESSFWRIPTKRTIVSHKIYAIDAGSMDHFVRKWLNNGDQERYNIQKAIFLYIILQPLLLLGCFVIPWLLLSYVSSLNKVFGTVTLSFDTIILSLCVAVIGGKEWERKSRKEKQISLPLEGSPPIYVQKLERVPSDDGELVEDEASVLDVQSSSDEDVGNHDSEDDAFGEPSPDLVAPVSSFKLTSPLPQFPENGGTSCWSKPADNIFRVRSATYLQDRVKAPSGTAPFICQGVDVWLTDNPERHIARHPSVLGGRLKEHDTFLVNFLLPFGNFVSYYAIPPIESFPVELAKVWTHFIHGDQQYRDARLKLLPVVVEGPWIVKAAVGPGTSPALLGKVIPLQYYFQHPTEDKKGIYEVDVIITASSIAKGILSIVKGHTKSLTLAFGFIIEATDASELPETVLCHTQIHALNLEECPRLPPVDLDREELLESKVAM